MSTRGWYEYYTINPVSKQMTLSMQFYKWGDATPSNALCEWQFFKKRIKDADGCIPVNLLDNMLREQLQELYGTLPENFSVAVFLFMLQRASETLSHFEKWRWERLDVPLKQRPDYRLGYAIGKVIAIKNISKNEDMDAYIQAVMQFIIIGHYIRPWKNYGLTFSVVEWLQYLTQVTLERDMGSIAGSYEFSYDLDYIHRFFIWVSPENPFKIDQIAIELCDIHGNNLFSSDIWGDESEIEDEYAQEKNKKLLCEIEKSEIKTFSLNEARKEFTLTPDKFWKISSYEYPELTDSVANFKYRA